MSAAPNYPLPQAADGDRRFNFGLMYDIAKVLEEHGFPKLSGVDHVDLMLALFGFVYASEDRPAPVVTQVELSLMQRAEWHLDLPDNLLDGLAARAVHAAVAR